jgi:hypothetical protein
MLAARLPLRQLQTLQPLSKLLVLIIGLANETQVVLSRSHMKRILTNLILVAGLFFTACEKKTPRVKDPPSSSGNPVTAPVDYLGAVAKAKHVADKKLDVTGVNQAIKLYEAQEGHKPKSLNDLVGDYLPQLPTPPTGMKFDYNPTTGEAKLVPK